MVAKASPQIRLACDTCDREDKDGISEAELADLATKGWSGITFMQSHEQSIQTFDPEDAPPGFDVTAWYTHVGTCPECNRCPLPLVPFSQEKSMNKSELPFLIARALKLLEDSRVLGITADGGHDSEVMIDALAEDGLPVTFIIRSKDIEETPFEAV